MVFRIGLGFLVGRAVRALVDPGPQQHELFFRKPLAFARRRHAALALTAGGTDNQEDSLWRMARHDGRSCFTSLADELYRVET